MAFLDKKELHDAYLESQVWSRDFHKPFDEFERLAANKVRAGLAPNYPKINDGTLSSQLPEMAMRRFPQLFTGRFYVPGMPEWTAQRLNILWNDRIVKSAKSEASFYTKMWNTFWATEKYGAAGGFAFLADRPDYQGADWRTIYVKNIKPEAGKTSPQDSNYIWLDFYFSKLDLKNIIEAAEKEETEAKKSKSDSFNTWDVGLLKKYYDMGPEGKDKEDENRTERDGQGSERKYAPYKLAVCLHKGYMAPFYTIIPALSGKCVRTRKNENPAGTIPLLMMYAIQNLENFYGRGVVEQAAGSQNYLDLLIQSDALATQISMEPPVDIQGSDTNGLQEKTIVFGPRRKWRTGNAKVKVVETNTSGYAQLDDRIGRAKGNVLNQLGSFDTTISAAAGDPQFSRTPAGVRDLGRRTSDTDNFYINNGREFFGQLAETMMNIHLANLSGKESQDINDDQALMLERAGWPALGKSRTVEIDYDEFKEVKTCFEVDPPVSAHDPERDGLLEGIKLIFENETALPQIQASGYNLDVGELLVRYFRKLNIDQIDRILTKVNPETTEDGSSYDTAGTEAEAGAVESDARLQAELQETMERYGVTLEGAQAIVAARRGGMSEEQIVAELTRMTNGEEMGA